MSGTDGHMGVGGEGNAKGLEGVRSVWSSAGPYWAVGGWPRAATLSFLFPFCQIHSTWGRNDFLSFWGDGSLLKNF